MKQIAVRGGKAVLIRFGNFAPVFARGAFFSGIAACAIAFFFLFAGCDTGSEASGSGTGDDTDIADLASTVDASGYAASVASSAASYDAADLVSNTVFTAMVTIDFDRNTAAGGSADPQSITSSGVTVLGDDSAGVTVTAGTYGVTLSSTLAEPLLVSLSGTLSGTFSVETEDDYQLYLDGLTITGSAGPALDLESGSRAFIVLAAGTDNILSDAEERYEGDDEGNGALDMKACLFARGPIVFSGSGSLSVTGAYKHGIFSTDYIRVCGGDIAVNVSAKDAIRCVNGFIFDDGTLVVRATGETADDESKGIKVEGDDSEDGAGKGWIYLNGGTIDITSVSKGITANWDIDEDSTDYAGGNPDPFIVINSGIITVTTTGTPYETTDSDGNEISCSPEGIEAKTDLTVNSGYIIVNTADDCLNGGDSITIAGGYLYCASTDNDSIDSNGSMTISGGAIVAIGAAVPEGAFDCDSNTFAVSGGTFIGIGGSTSTPTVSACTQNTVVLNAINAAGGTTFGLLDDEGNAAFAYTMPRTAATLLVSSPAIKAGTRYTVYTGGTALGDESFKGLCLGDFSYEDGSAGSSFTTATTVTSVGTSTGGPNGK